MKSTLKALQVLEALCQGEDFQVTQLSQDLGINYSTTHRILATLSEAGYVSQDNKTSKYRATLKVYRLGLKVRNKQPLVNLARPFMENMVADYGHTMNLASFIDNHAVVIDRFEGGDPLISDLSMGRQLPAYCTAFGKVFLAEMSQIELHEYADNTEFRAYTTRTITRIQDLAAELKRIKRQGFAVDERELDDGVRCVAAPIKDESGRVIGALSISGRTGTMTLHDMENSRIPLVKAASELSAKLGYGYQ